MILRVSSSLSVQNIFNLIYISIKIKAADFMQFDQTSHSQLNVTSGNYKKSCIKSAMYVLYN